MLIGNILKLDTPSMGSVGDGDSLVLLKADHLANSSILRISESNINLKSNSSYVHIRGGSHLPLSNDSSIVKEVCQHEDAGLDQDSQKFWKCTYDYALLSAGSKNFMQGTAIDINTEKNKYATPMIIRGSSRVLDGEFHGETMAFRSKSCIMCLNTSNLKHGSSIFLDAPSLESSGHILKIVSKKYETIKIYDGI